MTALALVLVVDRLLVENDEPARSVDFADRLTVQPSADGVYLLGNSMFKTGIDPDLLAEDMGSITPVDFEYHNGHYTNLWYLISRAALGQTWRSDRHAEHEGPFMSTNPRWSRRPEGSTSTVSSAPTR